MTVSNEIINILNDLGTRFGVVIDWSNQNIIPYIQDLVSRIAQLEMVNAIVCLIFGFICLVVVILCSKWFIGYYQNEECNPYAEVAIGVLVLVCFIAMIPLISIGIDKLPKAIYLPELAAIEYIQNIITKGGC